MLGLSVISVDFICHSTLEYHGPFVILCLNEIKINFKLHDAKRLIALEAHHDGSKRMIPYTNIV
jgi:hypothetical protein